uniref:Uncharacterized protein n=1 Tax=viral metagenome TaxID=1070528 RepID=A0A6M3JLV2_9ZZZZ
MGDHHCPECGTFSVDEPGPLTKRLEEAEATLAERDRLQTLHDASQRALTGALVELADARAENERLDKLVDQYAEVRQQDLAEIARLKEPTP